MNLIKYSLSFYHSVLITPQITQYAQQQNFNTNTVQWYNCFFFYLYKLVYGILTHVRKMLSALYEGVSILSRKVIE